MAKKKKQTQPAAATAKLPDPWCYYCDKRFKTEGVLIQHQKEKHFKCEICQRKLTSANGMKSHSQKRHSANVEKVPNALEGRDNFTAEVYGMKGIPTNMLTEQERLIYGSQDPMMPPMVPYGYPPMGMPPPFPMSMMPPMGMPPVPYGYPPMGMPPPMDGSAYGMPMTPPPGGLPGMAPPYMAAPPPMVPGHIPLPVVPSPAPVGAETQNTTSEKTEAAPQHAPPAQPASPPPTDTVSAPAPSSA